MTDQVREHSQAEAAQRVLRIKQAVVVGLCALGEGLAGPAEHAAQIIHRALGDDDSALGCAVEILRDLRFASPAIEQAKVEKLEQVAEKLASELEDE